MVRSLTEPVALAYLEAAAATLSRGCIVELGVYQGGSLEAIAIGAARNPRAPLVVGIDPWGAPGHDVDPRYERLRNRYGAENMVDAARAAPSATLIRGFSTQVAAWWAVEVGLLYIDALHTLEAVRADISAWAGHLTSGATVAFDDYEPRFPGVITAVNELGREVELIGKRLAVIKW